MGACRLFGQNEPRVGAKYKKRVWCAKSEEEACCKALTAECMSCEKGQTKEEFCADEANCEVDGCECEKPEEGDPEGYECKGPAVGKKKGLIHKIPQCNEHSSAAICKVSKTECAKACDTTDKCHGFDFEEGEQHACRLFGQNEPRVGAKYKKRVW